MASVTAANRYAKGMLQLAIESGKLDRILADMQLIRTTIEATSEVQRVLNSPVVSDEKKKVIVSEIFGNHVSESTARLLDILSSKSRFGLLYSISKAFEALYNQHAGIMEITISTAFDLDQKQIDAIVASISKSTGKKIQYSVKTDKSLIGGVAIKYNDTVIDGSVKNKLEQLTGIMQVPAV